MPPARRVIANITLSLDGRTAGPGGPYDMGFLVPHAVTDQARDCMLRILDGTTALLGRTNYQGFGGFWPGVVTDESADPRDRAFAGWLDQVEKVVFSSTLTQTPWTNARLATAEPADVVRQLRTEDGGDIWVLASRSVIQQLLDANEIDRLSLNIVPELVGAGAPLFRDGMPASSWTLADATTSDTGAVWLTYDRKRDPDN